MEEQTYSIIINNTYEGMKSVVESGLSKNKAEGLLDKLMKDREADPFKADYEYYMQEDGRTADK